MMTMALRPSPVPLVLAAALAGVPLAGAHEPPKVAVRELVRLQGFRRADGDAPGGRMTLRAQGTDQPFAATDRRAFALTAEGEAAPKVGDRYTLQGPRELIARFAGARPDQTITVLAEHRPGGADLFLLALDLCPPR
jgi:hypothetical protein